jgi:hypothetical protein
MHVRVDIAAVMTESFAPVRLSKKNLGHSAQDFSFAELVNSAPFYIRAENSLDSRAPVLLLR